MNDLDAATRPNGWELRMHPSTKRMATIGGFVGGGSGGIGSVNYGGLREPGNILCARVVTLEETPRVIELRTDAAQKVNRAYGTTGIITALEMPLAPAWPWVDVIVTFDDFFEAMQVGYDVALADGVVKKLITPMIWPIPQHFPALKKHCPEGKHVIFCMIAEPSLESFKAILGTRGTITFEQPHDDSAGKEPLYEYTWNHTTLQWLKQDRTITYLQCLFPHDRLIESVRQMTEMFPDEVLPHTEFIRFAGRMTCSALPIVRYTTEERLNEIIALHEKNGVFIANPHVYTLEDGTRHKSTGADQLGMKAEADPYGLLNPGKMRTLLVPGETEHAETVRRPLLYCHPLPESFHAAIRDEALAGLKEAGHTVDLCDLYAEKFDPVMSAGRAARLSRSVEEPVARRGLRAPPARGRRAGLPVSGLVVRPARDAEGLDGPAADARRRVRPVEPQHGGPAADQPEAHRRHHHLRPAVVERAAGRQSAEEDHDALHAALHRRQGESRLLSALSHERRDRGDAQGVHG